MNSCLIPSTATGIRPRVERHDQHRRVTSSSEYAFATTKVNHDLFFATVRRHNGRVRLAVLQLAASQFHRSDQTRSGIERTDNAVLCRGPQDP